MIDVMTAGIGAWLVVLTWLSAIRAVFAQGQLPPRATRWTVRLVAAATAPLADRLPGNRGERLLALCAPLAMLGMLGIWFVGTAAGFALLGIASGVAGQVPAGLGRVFDPAGDGPASLIGSAAALSSTFLVAVFIVYLVRVASAYNRRELLVARLSAQATAPSDAEQVIATYVQNGSRECLDGWFGEWTRWLVDVRCSHTGQPALMYFRSAGDLNWVAAAMTALDAAALVEAMAPDWAPANTRVLLETGAGCLRRLATDAGIVLPRHRSAVSLQGREQRGFADTMRMTVFAGLPVVRTQPMAWEAFQRERNKYAPYAAAIAARLRYGLDANGACPGPVVMVEQGGELLR